MIVAILYIAGAFLMHHTFKTTGVELGTGRMIICIALWPIVTALLTILKFTET